jgi:hypothetical protein
MRTQLVAARTVAEALADLAVDPTAAPGPTLEVAAGFGGALTGARPSHPVAAPASVTPDPLRGRDDPAQVLGALS